MGMPSSAVSPRAHRDRSRCGPAYGRGSRKEKTRALVAFFASGARSERLFYQPRRSLTHIPENPIVMQTCAPRLFESGVHREAEVGRQSISVPSRSKIRTRTSAKGAASELDVEACIEAKNYSSRKNIEARLRKVREFLCHGQGALVRFLLFGAHGRQC